MSADDKSKDAALDRLIKVFKCEQFGALIDIYVYYDEILRDVHTSPEKVNQEAIILAKKWETQERCFNEDLIKQ